MTSNDDLPRLGQFVDGPVQAVDGELGVIKDFYFDDQRWTIRYMVVDTGTWLQGRRVLIPLWALESPAKHGTTVATRLTRQQVKDSPDVDTHQPISRRAEARALAYYGYPNYWTGPALWGPAPAPGVWTPPGAVAGSERQPAGLPDEPPDEQHLRSWREVKGYHLRATDGEIGHIDDVIVHPETWRIEQLLVDTSNWIGGRTALVPVESVQGISWAEQILDVGLTRDTVSARADQHVGR